MKNKPQSNDVENTLSNEDVGEYAVEDLYEVIEFLICILIVVLRVIIDS